MDIEDILGLADADKYLKLHVPLQSNLCCLTETTISTVREFQLDFVRGILHLISVYSTDSISQIEPSAVMEFSYFIVEKYLPSIVIRVPP